MEIRRANPMGPSRPSRYCLGLQDDSVFADFDLDDEGGAFLLRISFDGYGCCGTPTARTMNPDVSKTFVRLMEGGDVSSGELASLLSQYFRENSDVIWKDALEEHGLLLD